MPTARSGQPVHRHHLTVRDLTVAQGGCAADVRSATCSADVFSRRRAADPHRRGDDGRRGARGGGAVLRRHLDGARRWTTASRPPQRGDALPLRQGGAGAEERARADDAVSPLRRRRVPRCLATACADRPDARRAGAATRILEGECTQGSARRGQRRRNVSASIGCAIAPTDATSASSYCYGPADDRDAVCRQAARQQEPTVQHGFGAACRQAGRTGSQQFRPGGPVETSALAGKATPVSVGVGSGSISAPASSSAPASVAADRPTGT